MSNLRYCANCDTLTSNANFCSDKCERDYEAFMDRLCSPPIRELVRQVDKELCE